MQNLQVEHDEEENRLALFSAIRWVEWIITKNLVHYLPAELVLLHFDDGAQGQGILVHITMEFLNRHDISQNFYTSKLRTNMDNYTKSMYIATLLPLGTNNFGNKITNKGYFALCFLDAHCQQQ